MADQIKVLIVDDIAATRESIVKLMNFQNDAVVVGQATNGEEAIALAGQLEPDIILMDINMPGMDGIKATEILATEAPDASIIIMSVQGEQEYLKRAMVAGAKNYLTKPFSGDELLQAVRLVYANEKQRKKALTVESRNPDEGKIIAVFSAKGGTGKSTLAVNLAVAIAGKTGAKVGIIDANLQFGDIALLLNILPKATMADLVKDMEHLDDKLLTSYLASFDNQVKVLPSPLRPEQAETISGAHMAEILNVMRRNFDYIIVDTAASFNEVVLSVLDAADRILVVAALDLPTLKNVKLCLEVMDTLGYGGDKVKLVLNRANAHFGMDLAEVEESLHRSFDLSLPNDSKTVMDSVNRGVPFVSSHPDAPVSQGIFALVKSLGDTRTAAPGQPQNIGGVVKKIKRLFG